MRISRPLIAKLSGAELGALDKLTEKALETQPH